LLEGFHFGIRATWLPKAWATCSDHPCEEGVADHEQWRLLRYRVPLVSELELFYGRSHFKLHFRGVAPLYCPKERIMPRHPPTSEQSLALELFLTGESLKINAFAGTGKTTTLEYLAEHSTDPGIYLAFNKSIAEEASGRFPSYVQCRTTHSLAYRSTPSVFRNNKSKMSDDLNPNAVAVLLRLENSVIGSSFSISARSRGALIRQTLKRFQHSDATEILGSHVPRWGKLLVLSKPELEQLIGDTAQRARTLWNRMLDPSDQAPLGHDGYFKRWSLNNPEVPGRFILLDEAQDTNPAMLAALRNQNAQVIYVGDKYQQIYEWRGAVNAMDTVVTQRKCELTQSFRFGEEIARAASSLLVALNEGQRIRGNPKVVSQLGCAHPNAILCRTNAGVMDHVVQAFAAGIEPFIVGGTRDVLRLLDGVKWLQRGQPTDVPEFFGFSTWREVVQFSESEEGKSIRTFVKLVERYGESKLRYYLSMVVQRETDSSLIISTAHKAKGREWDHVCVVDDFVVVKKDDEGQEVGFDEEELRLLYVALTRARLSVQIPEILASKFDIDQHYQALDLRRLSRPRVRRAPTAIPGRTAVAESLPPPTPAKGTASEPFLTRVLRKWFG
jgi:hypothetical protein